MLSGPKDLPVQDTQTTSGGSPLIGFPPPDTRGRKRCRREAPYRFNAGEGAPVERHPGTPRDVAFLRGLQGRQQPLPRHQARGVLRSSRNQRGWKDEHVPDDHGDHQDDLGERFCRRLQRGPRYQRGADCRRVYITDALM